MAGSESTVLAAHMCSHPAPPAMCCAYNTAYYYTPCANPCSGGAGKGKEHGELVGPSCPGPTGHSSAVDVVV